MVIGALALSGIPPFAGFWSKDEILLEAFHHDRVLFWIGLVGAFITAFYVFRMIFVTFSGRLRSAQAHPHESPAVMTVPLMVLAGFSAVIGLVGAPWWGNPFHHFVSFEAAEGAAFDPTLALLSTVVGLAGIFTAAAVYYWRWIPSASLRAAAGPLYTLLVRKYYWDEFYQWTVVRPLLWMARRLRIFDIYIIDGAVNAVGMIFVGLARLYRIFDLYVVDGAVNLVGWATRTLGGVLRYVQTGLPQNYLLAIALGVILLVIGGIIR
jgi:NADH-quinone oxidoreductase subunit L